MIDFEKVLAELKSEGLNEVVAEHGNNCLVNGNNCLVGSNNNCLFSYTQPEVRTLSQPDDQIMIQGLGNQCIV